MLKETTSFSLIIFCFVVLSVGVTVFAFKPLEQIDSSRIISTLVHEKSRLQVFHSFKNDTHTFKGSMAVLGCENFLTGVSVSSGMPAHMRLAFTVTPSLQKCDSSDMSPEPFLITVASKKPSPEAVLESVTVNNTATAFSVIEQEK